jgi:hypothetical protein
MKPLRITGLALGLWLTSPAGAWAQPRPPFRIGELDVAAGERADIDLVVAAGATDPATYIPVSVFHGAANGPVLALTMGVHGYEFAPILAGQALLERLDARELEGTVILVRIAHVEAFEGRVPYVNPHDRKKPTPENAERVHRALVSFGAPLQDLTVADLASPDLIFQIGVPPVRVDIITSIDGVEFDEAWTEKVVSEYAAETVQVLSRRHLIQNKKASGRLQDLADVEALEQGE